MKRASAKAKGVKPGKPPVRKVPTNVSIRADLVQRARSLGINLSQLLESALLRKIEEAERRAWLDENGDSIADYNARVEKHGTFGDGWRRF